MAGKDFAVCKLNHVSRENCARNMGEAYVICDMSSQRGWRYFPQGSHDGHPWPSLYQMCSSIECKCYVLTKLATDSVSELSLAHQTSGGRHLAITQYRDHHVSLLLHAQLW
jgi:hypothetical protein